jgi:polyisoprenoid-binding protein YceI
MESAGSLLMAPKLVPRLCLLLVMTVLVSGSAGAQDATAAATSELLSGTLSFVGHATVGDFVGSTSQVSGLVVGDLSGARGWIEAPVATLDTHNDRRDRDLRAAMEVDTYPTMRFDLDSTVIASSHDDARDAVDVLLHGRLAIHGVTRVVELPAAVSRRGDTLQVNAVFPLDVTDYRVGGLKKLFGILRMRRQIEVRADLRFVRATHQLNALTSSTQERIR